MKTLVYIFMMICFVTQTINAKNSQQCEAADKRDPKGFSCQNDPEHLLYKETYKAAVVEFAPDLDIPLSKERLQKNTKNYIHFIGEAAQKGADIIVFPEDGLTDWMGISHKTVDELSTEVPDAHSKISPCHNPNANYDKHLIDLSCAAASNKIYTVVNLIEKHPNNETKKVDYHNTNVVFDRNGVIVARYRKINLFNEPVFAPGNEIVTFETDFGVTFAVFICFDIMLKNPAIDVLANKSITNVVYSAAWFSHLPFYGALSIQHGYVKTKGVNLIVSGLNDPSKKNGGSGIYLHNGKIAQAYISGIRGSKLIIEDVPKVPTATPVDTCKAHSKESGRDTTLPELTKEHSPDISDFVTSREDLVNYTIKPLDMNKKVISEKICRGSFCCSFDITLNRNPNVALNYAYKLLAYYGVSGISVDRSIGIRNCVLVACLNETDSTCGGRHKEAPKGVVFESISVKGTFDPKTTHAQPSTLTYHLVPVTEYTYCTRESDGKMELELKTTNKQDSILTFGMYGRVFTHDDEPAGPIDSNSI